MRIYSRALKILMLALVGMLHAQQPPPDLILSNGKDHHRRRALYDRAGRGYQRRPHRGSWHQPRDRPAGGTEHTQNRSDGKAVTPGLIDNHMHLLRAATTWSKEIRFDGVESRKQAVEMLRARAKAAGPGEWVYNIGGWTHQQFADDPKPFTREELDQIAPNNPVALQESYFQMFLNSRGLQTLGIEANKPDPAGLRQRLDSCATPAESRRG